MRSNEASLRGSVVLTGTTAQLMSGSSLSAGSQHATVRLARGGELRVCPRTAVTVTTSTGGNDLMLSLNTGAVETHYTLASSADTIVTPDFRILLAGPGIFHFAIAADTRGNTCVKALAGNSAALIVTELMGDGVYQVRAHEQVYFQNGRVSSPTDLVPPDCGCADPPAAPVVHRAANTPVPAPVRPVPPAASLPARTRELPANSAQAVIASAGRAKPQPPVPALPEPAAETAPLPPVEAGEVHVQVDAPFVFNAREQAAPEPPTVARLSLATSPVMEVVAPLAPAKPPELERLPSHVSVVAPPARKPGKNVFRKIGGFFARIFGGKKTSFNR